jgi:transcription-repair coupling factor (superfamily II helicase)
VSLAEDLKRAAETSDSLELSSVPEGFDALVMADLARARGGLNVFVARDGSRAGAFEAAALAHPRPSPPSEWRH